MVVVHVASGGGMSGGIRQLLFLLGAQKEAGLDVRLCAPPDSHALRGATDLGIDARPLRFGNLWGQWKASRELRRYVAEVRADVVHTHHTKGHNVAVLATIGGPFPPIVVKRAVLYRPKFGLKFRTPRVNAILTNSRAVREVLSGVGVDPAKVRVVYNPRALPDLDRVAARKDALRSELRLDPSRPVVGAVGNGTPDKGFQFLVEAAPEILAAVPGAQFVLVGPHTERLAPRIAELGLSDAFRLTGFRSDAADLMALFDLFVFPSVHKDTCPNVVLEAMSLAVPVVSSDLTGMEEILPPEAEAAVMFRAGDPHALAGAAVPLLLDPERRGRLGGGARRRIETHHDPGAKVREILDLYREVTGKGT